MEQKWPQHLWLARHGQSAGNLARDAAEAAGRTHIELGIRDMDVPLSPLGERQARALGHWFAEQPPGERPNVVLSSPYLRARHTAQQVCESAGLDRAGIAFVVDERLREKEFGLLDGLTWIGIREKYPELSAHRAQVGKFYFRPPGGESWCDVILRLRLLLETITREYRRERVLVVGHQVTVNCFRYLLERLDERQILEIDARADVPNCSVTSYRFDPAAGRHGKLVLCHVNHVAPLRESGTPVTREPHAQRGLGP